jgi:hypothetical protein
MSEEPPFLEKASKQVSEKISQLLGAPIEISVHISLDRKLINDIIKIDSYMFRKELSYNFWELIARNERPGFAL